MLFRLAVHLCFIQHYQSPLTAPLKQRQTDITKNAPDNFCFVSPRRSLNWNKTVSAYTGGQNFEVCYFVPSLFSFFIFIVAITLNEAEKKTLQKLLLSKEPSVRYFLKVHDDSELGRHNVHVSKYTLYLKSSAAKLLLQWSMKRNMYN